MIFSHRRLDCEIPESIRIVNNKLGQELAALCAKHEVYVLLNADQDAYSIYNCPVFLQRRLVEKLSE